MAGHMNTILVIVVFAVLAIPVLATLLVRCVSSSKSKSRSSQSRHATDTEVHALDSTPATDPPPYKLTEAHPVVQSVEGQVVLTMEGGSSSEGVRAQQGRALARYEDPLSSTSSPQRPRPPAIVAQERRALGQHARNNTLSASSASHPSDPLPSLSLSSSPSVSASAAAISLASRGGNDQEQNQEDDQDLDLRAQVRQLQEEVERLRAERAAPPQELPPAYQSDAGSAC
jgi:outer membrane murein-binding lipoprotein Lpp